MEKQLLPSEGHSFVHIAQYVCMRAREREKRELEAKDRIVSFNNE